MNCEGLYHVKKEDLPRLIEILIQCFKNDPLYKALIPDEALREKLIPKLFACDVEEMFENCNVFADSEAINGLLIVSDETEPYHFIHYYMTELQAELKTDEYLIQEDQTLKTFWNFMLGKDYLNSKWTEQLHNDRRVHIIYLAIDPAMQHHNLSAKLMNATLAYAKQNKLMISLETHNEANVPFYEHFGFRIYEVVEKHFGLKQYCMILEN